MLRDAEKRGSVRARAGPHPPSAKHRPTTGLTCKSQTPENEWPEPPPPPHPRRPNADVRVHHQVPHCVQTFPTPTPPPSKVKVMCLLEALGPFLVSMQTMQWPCYEKTLPNWLRAYHSIQLRFVFESFVTSHSYNKLLGFKYLRTASKRSPLSVPSVLGHGAFCCIKSAGQTLIVFFYSWCRVE